MNIAVSEQIIRSRMRTIAVEMGALTKELTKPAPLDTGEWDTWKEGTEEMLASLDPGPIEIFDEDFFEKSDEAQINMDAAAAAMARMKKEQGELQKSQRESLEETAKAAALNATSAEDAAQRIVRAAFMEALAKQISNIMTKVPFPLNLAAAAAVGVGMTRLFDQGVAAMSKLKFAQHGMDEVVSSPKLIIAGEAGPERVQVTPQGRASQENRSGLTINFNGPVTNKEYVRDEIIPEIQRVQKLGLA